VLHQELRVVGFLSLAKLAGLEDMNDQPDLVVHMN